MAVSGSVISGGTHKFQNGATVNGVSPGGMSNGITLNHKQFSMSTQHGLFPKIINLRVEQQNVTNSTHPSGQPGLV
jgi:hypothetical protein